MEHPQHCFTCGGTKWPNQCTCAEGRKSALAAGCNASPLVDQDENDIDLEIMLSIAEENNDKYRKMIAELREGLQQIYADNGEDPLIAKICSPLIDKTRPPL